MHPLRSTRRDFLRKSGAAASTLAFPAILRSQDGVSPSSRLNLASVGVGGKGYGDLQSIAEGNNIVALCDVDDRRARRAYQQFPDAKRFRDFRVMFDKMGDQIDGITVSTADHMHYPIAKAAIQRDIHVCVQKPLCNTIWETRDLLAASRKHKVVTQMGIQGHTMEGIRLLKEWLDAGAIGKLKEIVYWTNRPIWPQGAGLQFPKQAVPDSLDWDLWQGTALERDYNEDICPFKWRGFWDYGCGALGDIGCHMMDAAFWALDLGSPSSVSADTTEFDDVIAPKETTLVYEFPAKGERPPIKVTWMDGGRMPSQPEELDEGRKLNPEWGQLFYGENGIIYANDAYCSSVRLIPERSMQEFDRPDKTVPRSPTAGDPQKEWVHGIKNGEVPGANFEYSAALTEMVLIGNLAIRAKKPIEWDGAQGRVSNLPEANDLLRRTYRKGWEPTPA